MCACVRVFVFSSVSVCVLAPLKLRLGSTALSVVLPRVFCRLFCADELPFTRRKLGSCFQTGATTTATKTMERTTATTAQQVQKREAVPPVRSCACGGVEWQQTCHHHVHPLSRSNSHTVVLAPLYTHLWTLKNAHICFWLSFLAIWRIFICILIKWMDIERVDSSSSSFSWRGDMQVCLSS